MVWGYGYSLESPIRLSQPQSRPLSPLHQGRQRGGCLGSRLFQSKVEYCGLNAWYHTVNHFHLQWPVAFIKTTLLLYYFTFNSEITIFQKKLAVCSKILPPVNTCESSYSWLSFYEKIHIVTIKIVVVVDYQVTKSGFFQSSFNMRGSGELYCIHVQQVVVAGPIIISQFKYPFSGNEKIFCTWLVWLFVDLNKEKTLFMSQSKMIDWYQTHYHLK